MYFPLIPRADALLILEEVEVADEARGEFLAEQGSSYFHGGMSSADASFNAQMDLAQREQDWAMSEEGQRFEARLPAARLYDDVSAARLDEWEIPEFVTGDSDEGAANELSLRDFFYDHSPLNYCTESLRGSSSDEDIPF